MENESGIFSRNVRGVRSWQRGAIFDGSIWLEVWKRPVDWAVSHAGSADPPEDVEGDRGEHAVPHFGLLRFSVK